MYEAKKSLGQNFFNNPHLAEKIVSYVQELNPENVIEIGPGTGSFTKYFASNTAIKRLILIEKDDRFIEPLKTYGEKIEIIHSDIMDVEIAKIFTDYKLDPAKTVFYGSLPYNISKPIIRNIVEAEGFQKAYFIIQKEVAEKYAIKEVNKLGMITKLHADTKILLNISPHSFNPRPKVNSSLISLTKNGTITGFSAMQSEKVKKLLRLAFIKPKKTLKNNLKGSEFEASIEEISQLRAFQVPLVKYVEIIKNL